VAAEAATPSISTTSPALRRKPPAMQDLRGATCLTSDGGCKKGGCLIGADKAIKRLI